ncbi:peptidylprolyl isomerase [bacterium DOLJORAL78_65_58]|nr:MAG: peptidylprolyl isomerase [bacterium DOLZORAL124_64_63]PIE76005.1 MAG: peptidylprolyl isomerase [bacterium DOLJORAL78_65_58]
MLLLVTGTALLVAGCGKEEPINPWHEIQPGLSYVDSSLGQGAVCDVTSFVSVNYTGYVWEADENGKMHKGRMFNSNQGRGPVNFSLGRGWVIQGMEKGMPGMAVGGKRSLLIEPELGYGVEGRPPLIPPNATLFFDVELVKLPKMQVEILQEGDGPVAEAGDRCSVEYTGWLWEDGGKGTQFDSSVPRGRPHQFMLGMRQVIEGWDRAIEGMKVGTKARLIIPPEMGYQDRGSGHLIPPNATLCFEVELTEIEGKGQDGAAAAE